MKYNRLNLGQIEALLNKIGGMSGVQRILSGQTVTRSVTPMTFNVWKTIKLGVSGQTASELNKSIQVHGIAITPSTCNIMTQPEFTISPEEVEVDLVVVSTTKLGLNDDYNRNDVCVRAMELGLVLCPAEVGAQLRRQYLDQPREQRLLVGMKPIVYPQTNTLLVFQIRCNSDGSRYLDGASDNSGDYGPGIESLWVFVKPRK